MPPRGILNKTEFPVHRSRFLAALKPLLGLILAKAAAMRVMINATGCPRLVVQLVHAVVRLRIQKPPPRRCSNTYIALRFSLSRARGTKRDPVDPVVPVANARCLPFTRRESKERVVLTRSRRAHGEISLQCL